MVELELLGISKAVENGCLIVMLRHENRVLPIVVGEYEAIAIQRAVLGEKMPRPMTHDLICNLLAGLHATLQSVTIYALENDTFYAHLNIEQHNAHGALEQILRIDSRPSDGIAIAVRVGCPIFASDDVMTSASHEARIASADEDLEDEEEGESDDDLGSEEPL